MEPSRIIWIERAILLVAVVAVFGVTIDYPYHLDDHYRIVGNPEIERVWPPWRHFVDPSTSSTLPTIVQYRPLLPLTLSITAWFSDALGMSRLVGHHAGNIALHAVSVLVVHRLVAGLAERSAATVDASTVGFWSALLFAIHPVSGVPVTYLAGRDLLLMQAAMLGALLVFVRIRTIGSGWWRWAGALFLLSVALTAKTGAVVAPALVFVLDVTVFEASLRSWRPFARAGAFALPVLGFFAFTEWVLDFSDAGQLLVQRPWFEYPLTQAELHLTYYPRNFVWPFYMRVLPGVEPASGLADPGAIVGVTFIVGTFVVAWRLRRRWPLVSACIGCYWVAFAATSWFLPLRYLASDYRQYSSLPWLCALTAVVVLRVLLKGHARVVLGLLAGYFGLSAVLVTRLWSDPVLLWGHAVRHGAEPQAHVNYGLAVQADDPALAAAHFREALRRAPHNVFAMINLGMLEIAERRFESGIAWLERAQQTAPDWPITSQWLDKGCRAALAGAGQGSAGVERCRQRVGTP